ncbi:hypothetical protein BRADI_1g78714v3 [Brachypodium distachyon]|uniref:Uncharacterized protein n=1 Tax=Brachypodium distachyon TaxID=15368 RepID=A0A2K2DVV4_BRADI|nr:hypothetical protein BRADI_1g78714v3 [Brachypodium distachyon]
MLIVLTSQREEKPQSQEYAAEHGLPTLKNVLLHKIKGYNCCLQELRSFLEPFFHFVLCCSICKSRHLGSHFLNHRIRAQIIVS